MLGSVPPSSYYRWSSSIYCRSTSQWPPWPQSGTATFAGIPPLKEFTSCSWWWLAHLYSPCSKGLLRQFCSRLTRATQLLPKKCNIWTNWGASMGLGMIFTTRSRRTWVMIVRWPSPSWITSFSRCRRSWSKVWRSRCIEKRLKRTVSSSGWRICSYWRSWARSSARNSSKWVSICTGRVTLSKTLKLCKKA